MSLLGINAIVNLSTLRESWSYLKRFTTYTLTKIEHRLLLTGYRLYSNPTALIKKDVLPSCSYMSTTLTLTKILQKKPEFNYTSILCAVSNKSWKLGLVKETHFGHLSHISQTILVWQAKYDGFRKRSKDQLMTGILLWTHIHWYTCVDGPVKTYIKHNNS